MHITTPQVPGPYAIETLVHLTRSNLDDHDVRGISAELGLSRSETDTVIRTVNGLLEAERMSDAEKYV